jgi:hypothetical protein
MNALLGKLRCHIQGNMLDGVEEQFKLLEKKGMHENAVNCIYFTNRIIYLNFKIICFKKGICFFKMDLLQNS